MDLLLKQEGILLNTAGIDSKAGINGATALWIACQVDVKNNLFHIFKFNYYGETLLI